MMGIKKIVKSYYFIIAVCSLVWLGFFDSNDLYTQYVLFQKVKTLKEERNYYYNKIEEVKVDREELLSNRSLLEKFARENYLMKKPTEDLYVIVEEKNQVR